MEAIQIALLLCLVPLAALIFKIPELGLVLCLITGALAKGVIQPVLGPIDITAFLFAITYGSIFIRSCMEKRLAMPGLGINILVLLLVILLLASLLYTPLPSKGTESFLRFVFLSISMLYATFMWCNSIERIKRLLFIFVGILLVYGTILFAAFLLFRAEFLLASRAAFLQTSILGVAKHLAAAVLIAFALRPLVNIKWQKIMLTILMIIGTIELVALNSRGPLIAFIVGGVCLFLLYSMKEKKLIIALAPLGFAVVALAFILLPSHYTARYIMITNLESSSIAVRLDMWQFVAQHFSEWFFTGAGLGGFAYYYAATTDPLASATYPHNIFLDIFADIGFFGFLVFAWLLACLFYTGVKMSRVHESSIRLLSLASMVALIVFLTGHLFSGTAIGTRDLWFAGGLILSLDRLWRNKNKESMEHALESGK